MPSVGERRARQAADWGGAMNNQQRCFAPAQNNHLNAITLHKGIVAGDDGCYLRLPEARWLLEVEVLGCLTCACANMDTLATVSDPVFQFPDTSVILEAVAAGSANIFELLAQLADEGGCLVEPEEVPRCCAAVTSLTDWQMPSFNAVAGLGAWNRARLLLALARDPVRSALAVVGDLSLLSVYRENIAHAIREAVEAQRALVGPR